MRLALLTPTYWPETRRGTERVVHDLATGLAQRGHQPTIVTSHPARPSRRTEQGVRVVRQWRPPHGPFARAGFPPHSAHTPLTAGHLIAHRPTLVQAFYPTEAALAGAWSRISGRPSVFSVMGIPRARALQRHPRSLGLWRRASRDCSAVVALSQAARRACQEELGVDARVIHPGVDLAAFRPRAPRAEAPTVICVGAAEDPRKRVPLLLEAFALVRRSRRDARLLLLRPADPRLATTLKAPGVTLFDPGDSTAEMCAAYASAWVSVLASEHEAFGLVLTEALACGTPIVGGADGATPEILGDAGVGASFDAPTADAVAAAILEALDLAAEPELGRRCRERAEQFSVARAVDLHESLYRDLGAMT